MKGAGHGAVGGPSGKRIGWRPAALALALLALPAGAREVTDSAGRTVEVPATIERVFPAGPPAMVVLYALAPQTLLGWTRAFRGEEASYVAAPYRDLPVLGRLTGRGDTANVEVVLATQPELIFDYGSISPTYVSLADRVQEQTGVPYLLIDGRFENTVASLRQLGEVLGRPADGARLADAAASIFAEVDAVLADVPEAERPRVYLARGPDGLETGLRGSINTEIIERVGAVNVADAPGQRGIANVSPEQILLWDPEVVVTWDEAFYEAVRTIPFWQNVRAVREDRVYLSPAEPFGWIDRPPSLNRLLGMKWLLKVLYPDEAPFDLRGATRDFYREFYHVDLGPGQLDALLAGSGG